MYYDVNSGIIFYQSLSKEEMCLLIDSIYFIEYNSRKGLYALKQLYFDKTLSIEDSSFRCHVYIDLLMEALGQLYSRFFAPNNSAEMLIEQAKNNRKQFSIDETNVIFRARPLRNYVTHIDERNYSLISDEKYYGTFNCLYPGMDESAKVDLLNSNNPQANLLDLIDMKYRIIDPEGQFVDVDLNLIEEELTRISKLSSFLWKELMPRA
ncbi:MAG: hypothetical protein ACOYH0_05695 [Saccharofermentanales bacterium]|jgi:ribosome assembly protein YihI (activator of Der GTPase)